MIDAERALRAYTDVLAVEWDAEAGVARVVTISDVYYAVPTEGQHRCPDREYHDPPEGACKHVVALEAVRGELDVPEGWLVVEDLDERTDPAFDLEMPDRIGRNRTLAAFEPDGGRVVTDGGERPDDCCCDQDDLAVACFPCYRDGFDFDDPANAPEGSA